jgi:hypothetical protein
LSAGILLAGFEIRADNHTDGLIPSGNAAMIGLQIVIVIIVVVVVVVAQCGVVGLTDTVQRQIEIIVVGIIINLFISDRAILVAGLVRSGLVASRGGRFLVLAVAASTATTATAAWTPAFFGRTALARGCRLVGAFQLLDLRAGGKLIVGYVFIRV